MNDYAVYTDNLTKTFHKFVAVDKVNLRIKKGEIYGFLGPNGAGKSTTVRMLCGIIAPTSGTGKVLDYDIVKDVEQIRLRIGYMSQKFSLYEDLTVLENLLFYAGIYSVPEHEKNERINSMLALSGLSDRKNELTRNLAGGWKQRLALACAIMHKPELLFLDEPTSGVDPISRRNFWDLIYSFSEKGVTIMVTTHYMDEAEHCDRLGFIYGGKLIAEGSPSELKQKNMQGELVELDAQPMMCAIENLKQMKEITDVTFYGSLIHFVTKDANAMKHTIISSLKENGITVTRYTHIPPSLEDIFVSLVDQAQREELRKEFRGNVPMEIKTDNKW
ncbi:MAG: ABC transporter ATP-binding protein [bacterium]|nr:ABC transporter ATP-binding protein [bacterium]